MFCFWWPKWTGKKLNETLGKWHFWTLFTGFSMTFLIQHWLGVMGMPRRVANYAFLPHLATTLNDISSIGSFILGASTLIFLYNIYWTWKNAPSVTADDPWGFANPLEWATSCPPPRHNFTSIPRIPIAAAPHQSTRCTARQFATDPGPARPGPPAPADDEPTTLDRGVQVEVGPQRVAVVAVSAEERAEQMAASAAPTFAERTCPLSATVMGARIRRGTSARRLIARDLRAGRATATPMPVPVSTGGEDRLRVRKDPMPSGPDRGHPQVR